MTEQRKNLRNYILPAMIGNLSFFVLTIVDGMFVGNGVGPDALGAVSLAMPFVNLIWALSTLFNIGGVAVVSVRRAGAMLKAQIWRLCIPCRQTLPSFRPSA